MTEKEKYKVFEFGYGGEFSINCVDATFRNERDAKRVADLLNSLSEKQRITNMTNQALIRFIKSKGYNVEEVLEFVNEL